MAKKADESEVKKECPSCGLGVALDSTICEFCGWDFEEEDEWILQIEKLERELLLEKQKFEPGTVDEKIQSTLRAPVLEKIAAERSSQAGQPSVLSAGPKRGPSPQRVEPQTSAVREIKASGVKVVKPIVTTEMPKPVVRMAEPKAEPAKAESPTVGPSRAKPVAPARPSPEAAPAVAGAKTRKTRVVRKVKLA